MKQVYFIFLQASQQNNFGCLRDQPGILAPAPSSFEKFWIYVYHRILPRYQVFEIEALSIRTNFYARENRVESHIFASEEFESK